MPGLSKQPAGAGRQSGQAPVRPGGKGPASLTGKSPAQSAKPSVGGKSPAAPPLGGKSPPAGKTPSTRLLPTRPAVAKSPASQVLTKSPGAQSLAAKSPVPVPLFAKTPASQPLGTKSPGPQPLSTKSVPGMQLPQPASAPSGSSAPRTPTSRRLAKSPGAAPRRMSRPLTGSPPASAAPAPLSGAAPSEVSAPTPAPSELQPASGFPPPYRAAPSEPAAAAGFAPPCSAAPSEPAPGFPPPFHAAPAAPPPSDDLEVGPHGIRRGDAVTVTTAGGAELSGRVDAVVQSPEGAEVWVRPSGWGVSAVWPCVRTHTGAEVPSPCAAGAESRSAVATRLDLDGSSQQSATVRRENESSCDGGMRYGAGETVDVWYDADDCEDPGWYPAEILAMDATGTYLDVRFGSGELCRDVYVDSVRAVRHRHLGDWMQYIDPTTARPYYHNLRTSKSEWECPV